MLPLMPPMTALAASKLKIGSNYRPVVSDKDLEQKYGRHSIEHHARTRQTFEIHA